MFSLRDKTSLFLPTKEQKEEGGGDSEYYPDGPSQDPSACPGLVSKSPEEHMDAHRQTGTQTVDSE